MVQPRSASCGLEIGSERARFDPGQPGIGVDLDQPVHPAHVERDHRAGLVDVRLEAARDVAAAAERDDHGILGDGGRDHLRDLALIRRVDHDIRGAADLVGADAHQVAQALAVRVHDALHRVGRDEVLADDRGQLADEAAGREAARDRDVREGGLLRQLRGVQIQPDRVQHERGEPGLVIEVEPHSVDSPAPPLHVLDVGH